jgi:hypothetical protein
MTNEDTYKYCEHKVLGVGAALMIKPRNKPKDDLWMVTFQSTGQNEKYFFCTKNFDKTEDLWFIDEAHATRLYKEGRNGAFKKRTKTVHKDPKNLSDLLDSLFPA